MAKQTANNPSGKRKLTLTMVIIYGIFVIIWLYACTGIGAVFDISLNAMGKIDSNLISVNIDKISDTGFVISALKKGGYAPKMLAFGAIAVIMLILILYSNVMDKKFHRKGEEHGSAWFATKSEANEFADKQHIPKNPFKRAIRSVYFFFSVAFTSLFNREQLPILKAIMRGAKFMVLKSPDGKRVFDKNGEFCRI
jgi:uncharacterized membrane protein